LHLSRLSSEKQGLFPQNSRTRRFSILSDNRTAAREFRRVLRRIPSVKLVAPVEVGGNSHNIPELHPIAVIRLGG
jgi:hypothetical protein